MVLDKAQIAEGLWPVVCRSGKDHSLVHAISNQSSAISSSGLLGLSPHSNAPSYTSMMLIVMVMIMIASLFLSLPDRLWLQRCKPGRICILFRQLDEYHDHGFRVDMKLATSRQHILW